MSVADNDPNRTTERSAGRMPGTAFGMRVKSLLAKPRLILNPLLLLVFCAAWIREFLYWFPTDAFGTSLNYWAYTDWLIDYSQGFIRRGLSGEMWRLVPATIPPVEFVAVLSWILILAAALGYLRLLARSWKAFHPLTLFGLLFLPSLFIFYLHDHDAIARKEILGYITVLLHLLVIERSFPLGNGSVLPVQGDTSSSPAPFSLKGEGENTGKTDVLGGAAAQHIRFSGFHPRQGDKKDCLSDPEVLPDGNLRRYAGWLIPIAVILIPAIILVHEGNFLLFVPLHGMMTLSILQMKHPGNFKRAALWTGLLYLPAAVAFFAVYLTGTPGYPTLLGICEKWASAGAIREGSCFLPPDKLSGSTLPGSFIPMEWSLGKAAYITRTIIFMNWAAWIVILPALGACLWYLARQAVYSSLRYRSPQPFPRGAARRYAGLFFRKYFLIPLLLSLPVYFTAYDYGRWFTVTCINFAMLAVSANLPHHAFALQKKTANEEPEATGSLEHLDHNLVFYGVSVLICILALVLWLPHYCLFQCEIIRSPLEFFSHTFLAR